MEAKMLHIKENLKKPEYFVYIILAAMFLVAVIVSPGYLQSAHMSGLLKTASFLGIAAIGQTFAILLGDIDLSIANTITLGNVLGAQILMGSDSNLLKAFVIVIMAGVLIGVGNGIGIRYLKLDPFIMTLGMSSVIEGIFMIYTQGAPKGKTSPFMSSLCKASRVGFITGVFVIWIVLVVIAIFVMKKTTFGRNVFAVGANKTAARFSGINTTRIYFIVYIISAVLAIFAGFLLVGYTGTSYLDVGVDYNDNSIAAVIIGGTAVTGGRGGYLGTLAGVMLMVMLVDFLTIVNIPEAGRQIIQGGIIIVLLLLYNRDRSNH